MFKRIGSAVLVGSGMILSAVPAFAMDWTGISLDTSDMNSAYALVVPGLIVIWGIRKVIKVINRS